MELEAWAAKERTVLSVEGEQTNGVLDATGMYARATATGVVTGRCMEQWSPLKVLNVKLL